MYKRVKVAVALGFMIYFIGSAALGAAGEVAPQLQGVLDAAKPNEKIAVIVQFHEQLDRKQFRSLKKNLRRVSLLKELKQQATRDQAPLKSYLMANGGKKMRSLWIINGLAVEAKPSVIKKIAERPDVQEVRLDTPVLLVSDTGSATGNTQWNIAMVGADLLWDKGYLGQGVVVASMDSGVDYGHADLAGNWRGGTNSWFDPHGEHQLPYDATGHGTQTMGIMVGQNLDTVARGMAPQAQWIAVKLFDDNGFAMTSDIHAGFQWLLDPDNDPNTDDAPDIVNNSWGFPESANICEPEFQLDIQTLRDLDINVVFSAGNSGGTFASISPANNPGVFSVGAVDQSAMITGFSNQGPSACGGGIYPSAVAPGDLISTSDLTSGFFPNNTTIVSGTSFAAPHVSGAMALLLSSNPDLTSYHLEEALLQSSTDLGEPGDDNTFGSGLINVAGAYDFLNQVPQCTDNDGDGYFAESTCGTPVDCDDFNPGIFPGALEILHDTIDQNCDGYDLTINIAMAVYKTSSDKLIIVATSSLGSVADLQVEIPGMLPKALYWKDSKQQWQRVIKKVLKSNKRLQLNSDTIVTVSGPEGAVSIPLTIKK